MSMNRKTLLVTHQIGIRLTDKMLRAVDKYAAEQDQRFRMDRSKAIRFLLADALETWAGEREAAQKELDTPDAA
jgi:metal-responsive CopG/Arc/MetJ family transcriptional regulator